MPQTITFGVNDDKSLTKPVIGSRSWGNDMNVNQDTIASELKDLSSIKLERISQEVRDALGFAILGSVPHYSDLPDPQTIGVNNMYVVQYDEDIGGVIYGRGIYKVVEAGGVYSWLFFVNLDPIETKFTDLIDVPSSYVGENEKSPVVDEANNRIIFERLAKLTELEAEEQAREDADIILDDKIDTNYNDLNDDKSNTRLDQRLDTEALTRQTQVNDIQDDITTIENTQIGHQNTLINHEGRITSLEHEERPAYKDPCRYVIDNFVSENTVWGGTPPSQYGYLPGNYVAINEPAGSIHNGSIYKVTDVDTWLQVVERFKGLSAILKTTLRLYTFTTDDQIGQYLPNGNTTGQNAFTYVVDINGGGDFFQLSECISFINANGFEEVGGTIFVRRGTYNAVSLNGSSSHHWYNWIIQGEGPATIIEGMSSDDNYYDAKMMYAQFKDITINTIFNFDRGYKYKVKFLNVTIKALSTIGKFANFYTSYFNDLRFEEINGLLGAIILDTCVDNLFTNIYFNENVMSGFDPTYIMLDIKASCSRLSFQNLFMYANTFGILIYVAGQQCTFSLLTSASNNVTSSNEIFVYGSNVIMNVLRIDYNVLFDTSASTCVLSNSSISGQVIINSLYKNQIILNTVGGGVVDNEGYAEISHIM